MANKHYKVNEEFEVTVTFKVKLKEISNYYPLTEEQIQEEIEEAKREVKDFIVRQVEYDYCEELTMGVDTWIFDIEEKEA